MWKKEEKMISVAGRGVHLLKDIDSNPILVLDIRETLLDILADRWISFMKCGHYCNNVGVCFDTHPEVCCACTSGCSRTCKICGERK